MIIPDGGKPIKVGDPSFIYKGVYHPIVWFEDKPYRPRVEMLVIRNGREVFLRIKDNIDKVSPEKRKYEYRVPGGSIDADSSQCDQAIAETNEEALINVALVYNSGIQYYEQYEPGFLLKGGDMPIEYVGSVTDVFIGVYTEPYDKSKVEEKDLDDDMAENGKFYVINDVAKYLRKEHVEALIHSQFISNETKFILNLCRSDIINESMNNDSPIIVPGGKLYHGTCCDIDKFQPMSIDLGNSFDKPGWSTFCFGEFDYAKLYAASEAFNTMLNETFEEGYGFSDTHKLKIVFVNGYLVMSKGTFEYIQKRDLLDKKCRFYVYTINADGLNIGIGNDPSLKEYTFRESDVPYEKRDEFNVSIYDLRDIIEVTDKDIEDIIFPKVSEYAALKKHNYLNEKIVRDRLNDAKTNGDIQPGDDIEQYMQSHNLDFSDDDIHIPDLSCNIDEPIFESFSIDSIIMEKKYPDDCYGLPDRKAYPMPDAKHVKSAIRFFNYAKQDEEEELARNIIKKIKKFHVKDINVGKKNRFGKYYQPITESFSLEDYLKVLEQLTKEVQDKSLPVQKKYQICDKERAVLRMMLQQFEQGDFDDKWDGTEDKGDFANFSSRIVNMIYATLAECQSNQMEYMSQMEASEIRTLDLKPIMEADDDEDEDEEETATDYTAMADDEGAEDDDNKPDEATGGEGATDYTAMADEEGAEDDEGTGDTEEPENDNSEEEGTDDSSDTSDTEDSGDEQISDEPEGDNTTSVDDTSDEESGDDTGNEGSDDEATDYTDMADDAGAEGTVEDDAGEGDEGDTDTETSEDDTSSDDSSMEEDNSENGNRYDNKEIKNYFLLNSFLSMHQTVIDVLDSVNGVVLPTPDANNIMAKVVKNLQDVKTFIEKFIQFQFSESDYAFNLYYYNILMSTLRMNLKLFKAAVDLGNEGTKIKNRRRNNKS